MASGCKQRPADWSRSIEPIESPAIHFLHSSDSMGSIDLHQLAGLCLQPEAAQDNPQNLYRLPEQQCYAMFTRPFSPTHTQKKKVVWLSETTYVTCLCYGYQHLENCLPVYSLVLTYYKSKINVVNLHINLQTFLCSIV